MIEFYSKGARDYYRMKITSSKVGDVMEGIVDQDVINENKEAYDKFKRVDAEVEAVLEAEKKPQEPEVEVQIEHKEDSKPKVKAKVKSKVKTKAKVKAKKGKK